MKALQDVPPQTAAKIRKHEILILCNRIEYYCCGDGHLVDENLDLKVLEQIEQHLEQAYEIAEKEYS